MESRLYNPFIAFKFDNRTCFLTGESLESADEQVQVFHVWMMKAFDLEEKRVIMLVDNIVTYKSLKLPCSMKVAQALEQVEEWVAKAMKAGYGAVNDFSEH